MSGYPLSDIMSLLSFFDGVQQRGNDIQRRQDTAGTALVVENDKTMNVVLTRSNVRAHGNGGRRAETHQLWLYRTPSADRTYLPESNG